jgi:molybdopterin-guanine dinucleotide biosynthesis protein
MLVVVGGHARNIGKTSVAVGLIRKLRDRQWAAVKVTQYGHGICSREGEACGCEADAGATADHPYALSEEYEANGTDSGRFLAAGARRSFWLRTPVGQLDRAAGTLRKILAQNEYVIMESNSVLELVEPDVFLMLLDFSSADCKPSSLRFMDRADAFVVIDRGINVPLWAEVARGAWGQKPQFPVTPPDYVTTALTRFVKSRFPGSGASGANNSTRLRP